MKVKEIFSRVEAVVITLDEYDILLATNHYLSEKRYLFPKDAKVSMEWAENDNGKLEITLTYSREYDTESALHTHR